MSISPVLHSAGQIASGVIGLFFPPQRAPVQPAAPVQSADVELETYIADALVDKHYVWESTPGKLLNYCFCGQALRGDGGETTRRDWAHHAAKAIINDIKSGQ